LTIPPLSEFWTRFKNDPEACQHELFEVGKEICRSLVRQHGIGGRDLNAVATLIDTFVGQYQGNKEIVVEGNEVKLTTSAFCPIMTTALTQKIPWTWLCPNAGWPIILGVACSIIPDLKHRVVTWRAKGDAFCTHVFEKPEGK